MEMRRPRLTLVTAWLAAAAATVVEYEEMGTLSGRQLDSSKPRRAYIEGRQFIKDGHPFLVRGICYSPVPINSSVYWDPHGDFFTVEYSFIWLRDLPLMKAMGANVVRIYGWDALKDHTAFLDAVHANNLSLMTTFYMGEASETPIATQADRDAIIKRFVHQVGQYRHHPALMIWSFGNELNGVWNGFLQQLSKATDIGTNVPCGWDERYDDLGGCWMHKQPMALPGTPCYESAFCVYSRLFSFLDDAARAAHELADVIVVSAFADVDGLYDKVQRAGDFAPNLDTWTAQVYRGNTFGDFFEGMSNASDKPVLLTEYGVDAYHDVCGEGKVTPCFNMLGDDSGSFEDETSQAAYAGNLTLEISHHASIAPECKDAKAGDTRCASVGGFLMSWVDEYWKGAKSQAGCKPTYDSPDFTPAGCDEKAHVTCGNWDTSEHDLCGYFLDAAPDHYVNEEWFGLTAPTQCADMLDSLRPREVYFRMQELWWPHTRASHEGAPAPHFPSCDYVPTTCAALGTPGLVFPWIEKGLRLLTHGKLELAKGPMSHTESGEPVCSGHGKCTTDWHECGSGSGSRIATPCCSCDFGFAGEGCAQLDARMYVALGVAALAALLLTAMVTTSIGRATCGAKRPAAGRTIGGPNGAAFKEPLLST